MLRDESNKLLTVNEAAKFLKANYPDMWNDLYPKIYEDSPRCGEYVSPKAPAVKLCCSVLALQTKPNDRDANLHFAATFDLCSHQVPMYWLGFDIAQAILRTSPPAEIHWPRMRLPFDAGVMMLPKGVLRCEGEDAGFIIWNRYNSIDARLHVSDNTPEEDIRLMISVVSASGITLWINIAPGDVAPAHTTVNDLCNVAFDHPDRILDQDDSAIVAKGMHLLLGMFALMDSRPELITRSRMLKTVGKRNDRREFWTPIVVGEHYRIKHEEAAEAAEGTHASPRMHWVRGFWREQPYGPERGLRKMRWIEPFMRGVA